MSKQCHLLIDSDDIGKFVILVDDLKKVPIIASYFDSAFEVASNREFIIYTGFLGNIKVSTASTGIGCPSAAICIEEFINAGANTFIKIGITEPIDAELNIEDFIISSGAVREDGTSRQYVPETFPAFTDVDVSFALRESAKELGLKTHMGITYCNDAFYHRGYDKLPLGELNKSKWSMWQKSNVIATSLESSVLMIISALRKVRYGEVFAIREFIADRCSNLRRGNIDKAIEIAVHAIRILANAEMKK